MSRSTDIADLLRKASNASTLSESTEFMRQAEELKSEQHTAALADGEWASEDAVIHDTLVPGRTHELHTAATDWIVDLEHEVDPRQASQSMVAEASLWYARVNEDVKSYGEEYDEQARNLARKLSGQYGEYAETAEHAFLAEASRLRLTAVKAGLVKEAGDAGKAPDENKGPGQKQFDKSVEDEEEGSKDGQSHQHGSKAASLEESGTDLYHTAGARQAVSAQNASDDLFAVLAASDGNEVVGNPGVYNDDPALTSSNRAPALQELNGTSQDVVSVNDPGLGKTDDLTGANATHGGEQDHASKGSFPVHGQMNKESSMAQQFASCPTCGGHGKVAVRQQPLPSILDITKEAVSGLDQIDQTVDPHDNGPAPTPYPAEVAFPWLLNPQAQIPAAINQAEEQIAQRNSLSPTQQGRSQQPTTAPRPQTRASFQPTAGGRDNSGWMGDDGARGVDYPGEQIGQYPAPSTSEGYVDPAHGQGGDVGNRPVKPYGAMEADDYTNNPDMNWQPGQDTHGDQGWKEVLAQDPALQSAASYLEQRRQAYLRSGR